MGQGANILDFQGVRRPKVRSAALASAHVGYSDLARLIPGTSDFVAPASAPRPILRTVAKHALPRFCHRLDAGMLAPTMVDLALITMVFSLETWALGSKSLHLAAFCGYLLSFLIFAIEEELYCAQKTAFSENAAASRAVAWATLCAGLFLGSSPTQDSGIVLCALSLGTLVALVTARQVWRTLRPTEAPLRNVLVLGSEIKAAQVAQAIQRDPNSSRVVKGYITENHLRNNYGAAMLSRVARQEFVDELIIASSDRLVADVAIQEARKNKLDLKIAPDICVPVSADVDFENLGGLPLLKLEGHRRPERRLALKRGLDFVLAICGLLTLSPLLLLIAAAIKLDSPGPVFYCAPRTGCKGRRFICYKFRTMVRDAEALKDELRPQERTPRSIFQNWK